MVKSDLITIFGLMVEKAFVLSKELMNINYVLFYLVVYSVSPHHMVVTYVLIYSGQNQIGNFLSRLVSSY